MNYSNMRCVRNYKGFIVLIVLSAYSFRSTGQVNISDLATKRIESDSTIVWQQVSCGNGGMSNTLRYHPTIPQHITFLGDMWCAYQSTNNGARWYSITDHDGHGSFERQRDLIYSTSDPEFGISVCASLMWQSQDTGKSWQEVPNCPWYELDGDGLDRSSWISKVAGLGIDPNDKNVWFVGGGKFVRGDVSFSCYKNPTQAAPFESPVRNEGKLWRTKNGGANWVNVGGDLDPKAQVGPVKFHPDNSQMVFAASTHGVYRSEDGGNSWVNISEGKLDNNIIMDLDYYYNTTLDTFILYAIDQVQYYADGNKTKCSGGVFQSRDNGETWENINGNLYLDFNRLSGSVPNYYYRYLAKWFGISESEARSTFPELPTKALQPMDQLTTDPTRMGALYVGLPSTHTNNSIMPGRLWTTDDNGETWTNTARLYTHVWEKDSVYWKERGNPWHHNLDIGHESNHVQWGNIYALRGTRGLDVGIDGSVMMLSEHTTSLSYDHGKTWQQVDEDFTPSGAMVGRGNSDLPGHVIAQDKRQEQTYLGSGEHRLWITTDDSPDERQAIKNIMSSVETISTIAFDPYDGNLLYSTSSRQAKKQDIYRSEDGGKTWRRHGKATPGTDAWGDDFYTHALTIDPIDNNYMYHGVTKIGKIERATEGGFFRSTNGGKTFTQSNNGLPSPARIRDIQFDPRDTTHASLFIAAQKYSFTYDSPQSEGGLYHSSTRGNSWTKVNLPSSIEGVEHIRFDHTNRMYITTGYRGGGDGVWFSDDFGKTWEQLISYPRVQSIDISPFDHNLIVIVSRYLSKNPGVLISRDRGLTWSKSNKNIVVPQHIEAIHFDIHNAGTIWIATLGTGFYKGQIKDGDQIQAVNISANSVECEPGLESQLSASIVNPDFEGNKISWKSSNPSIATVDQNGLLTIKSPGKVKIWATVENGRFSDYTIVVVQEKTINSAVKNQKPQFKIMPVPVENKLFVLGIDAGQNFRILTVMGKEMITGQTGEGSIPVETLSPGVYIIAINGIAKKFIKR